MMENIANYIIFHPDKERTEVKVKGNVIIDNKYIEGWEGGIWVDNMIGNEDPFVFDDQWAYSYCHATQLRRNDKNDSYIQKDSVLFFCSGDNIDKGEVTLDTVFVVNKAYKWSNDPQNNKPILPKELSNHYKNTESGLWNRHLKFPFDAQPQHYTPKKGNYTYLSANYKHSSSNYSFIPLVKSGIRTTIPLRDLSQDQDLVEKINQKKRGKIPVLISENQKEELLKFIERKTNIKVVEIQEVIS